MWNWLTVPKHWPSLPSKFATLHLHQAIRINKNPGQVPGFLFVSQERPLGAMPFASCTAEHRGQGPLLHGLPEMTWSGMHGDNATSLLLSGIP